MKIKYFIPIFIILFIGLCIVSVNAATFDNGDFESGNGTGYTLKNGGWWGSSTAYPEDYTTVVTESPYEGTYVLKMHITADSYPHQYGFYWDNIDMLEVQNISFFAKGSRIDDKICVDMYDTGTYNNRVTLFTTEATLNTDYTRFSKNFIKSGTKRILFYVNYGVGGAGQFDVFIDDIRINNVSLSRYIISGLVCDVTNNEPLSNVVLNLQNSEGSPIASYSTDNNGTYSITATSLSNGNYRIQTVNESYYESYNTFIKPNSFIQSGNNFIYDMNIELYPIGIHGYITTIYINNRTVIKPSTFTIYDYNLNNTTIKTSNIGVLDYNFTKKHQYKVTCSVNDYEDKDLYVNVENDFFEYAEMEKINPDTLIKYHIEGYTMNIDYTTYIGNVLVCLYNPNGDLISSTYSSNSGYYMLNIPVSTYSTYGDYTVEGNVTGYYNRTSIFTFDAIYFNSVDYYLQSDIYLIPSGTNEGTGMFIFHVYDYDGITLLNNVNITIFDFNTNAPIKAGLTKNGGYLQMVNLQPGDYTVNFVMYNRPNGYLYKQTIVANEATEIFYSMNIGNTIKPTVTANPTYHPTVAPTPNPTNNPDNPTVTPYPDIGNQTITSITGMLTSWGISGNLQGYVIGLFIILIFALIPMAAASYTHVKSDYLVEATMVMALIGFFFVCIMNLFPIWLLVLFGIIAGAAIAWKRVGGQ